MTDQGLEVKVSNTETETKVVETTKENTQSPESTKESDVKATSQTTQTSEENISKQAFDAVKGDVSAKSKQIQELDQKIRQIQNQSAVKDLLLESELPDIVKQKIKSRINDITPDSFETISNEYLEVFNGGLNAYKTQQVEAVNKVPSKKEDIGFAQKIDEVQTIDQLKNLLKSND
tara:strand:+ start:211 stop:738 length:528 start_codon:yes stop_codon:yes gene_type:complete